jgi:hypothetical protein
MSNYGMRSISTAMATVLLSCVSTQALPQTPPPENSARATIAESQAIASGGVDELKTVDIGDIKQWIRVRGTNPANPILLFIHGGPGSPMMPESWIFQRPWEDFFTVVQWDQRGAGKTFAASGRQPDKSMSLDQIQADAEQLIDLLRQTYGKKKDLSRGTLIWQRAWGASRSASTGCALCLCRHRAGGERRTKRSRGLPANLGPSRSAWQSSCD